MEIIKTIRPGQQGAKGYSKRYGDELCAVRYRVSPCGKKLYTTVEIIVDERERPTKGNCTRSINARKKAEPVAVKVFYSEGELRELLRNAGARWSKVGKAWVTSRDTAVKLGLRYRIAEGLVEKCSDVDSSLVV